jgi:imidazolonepropionase-like amidohydrolase
LVFSLRLLYERAVGFLAGWTERCPVRTGAAFGAAVLWVMTVAAALSAAPRPAPPSVTLTHVTVIDVSTSASRPDQTVVIGNGRVVASGPAARVKTPAGSRVIDAHGKFLIPGLWDMHVHLAGVNADPAWSKQVLLPLLIAHGITGVRDMGGDLAVLLSWKREMENGTLLAPHIVAAGPWLAAGGDKTPEQYPVADPDAARAAVRDLKRQGGDFIKIVSLPSKETFFAVADESKKQGITFCGHLPFQVSVIEASNAGIHSIEHLLYSAFSLSFSSKEEDLRERLIAAEEKGDSVAWEAIAHEADATYSAEKAATLFATLKKNGTWVTPTLFSLDTASHPEEWTVDDAQLDFLPASLARQWRESLHDNQMRERAAWLARQAANDWKLTAELHRAGITLLAGSDSLDPYNFIGDSLHKELGELVRAGLTPGEALQTATRGAARFLGRDRELGSIESGKIADLVLLDANPLDKIQNTEQITAVIRGGNYLDRAALDKLLAQAKSAAAAVPAK